MAKHCAERGIRLVHFSTDQVFDGSADRPRREEEEPNPCNAYAESKLAGERNVSEVGGKWLTLRVQWLYGEKKDRFSILKEKAVFTPFSDQIGAPTWTRKLAETVVELTEREAQGLFHFAYDDAASWAEVFQLVKSTWNLPLELRPQRTADVKLPARRPLFSVLSNQKLCRTLNRDGMGSWRAPFLEFLAMRA